MQIYNVPIIQSDLRHEETIIQAINSLEYLQNVITSVFDRINTRIERNTNRIGEINRRIEKANAQVENLIGINKAINIFSSSKYPAANLFQNIELTFITDPEKYDEQVEMKDDWAIRNSLDPVNHKNIHGKLQFYHVRGKNEPKIKMNKILSPPVGLGKLPLNIQSVNSLLIFNTDQNPYECYNQIDPLLNNDRRKQQSIKMTANTELDAAPFSITHRKSIVQKQDFLLYTPSVRDAPELDLPVDLPDLPGVVDDVVFNFSETDFGIQPSRRDAAPPDLPDIEEITPNIAPAPQAPPIVPQEVINAVAITKINNAISAPPPPPPPPLPPTISVSEETTTLNNLSKSEMGKATLPNISSAGDIHSNLMDAIRKAGGRTVRINEPGSSASGEPKKIKSSNDLMSDLHNKLAARRKGISGFQNENNVASSISSMIPPPAVKLNSSQSNTEASEEEWE